MVRLPGSDALNAVFADASAIIDTRHRARALPLVQFSVERRLVSRTDFPRFDAPELRVAPIPAIVALTALLANPTWAALAFSGPAGWDSARQHIADTITGDYRPTGIHDALVCWKNRHRPR